MTRKANRALVAAAAAASISTLGGAAVAQAISTQGQAFDAGRSFSNGAAGKGAAAGAISTTSGTANVPKYNTNPPEKGVFGGGKGLVGGAGNGKILNCETYAAGSAYDQQECNAVNYLQKLPSKRVPFVIDKTNDPLLVKSKDTIANPGTIAAASTAICRIEKTTIPGTTTNEQCEESTILAPLSCNRTLVAQCGYIGTPIRSHSESKNGAFLAASMTPTGTLGLYDYLLEVPYRNCSGEGSGEVVFDLDTIGFGSYITVNLSNLDDAAAVGVNGTTVFAGYPNSGPHYSGATFPSSAKAFQIGYGWSEEMGRTQCTAWDGNGACTQNTFVSSMQSMSASAKLLDFCPAGYAPTSMLSLQTCNADTGTCTAPSGNTASQLPGFFCNAEGKFLMNRREGPGTWAGTVSSQMPLQKGENRISVYWGTGTSRSACGNVRVSGQIYNVAPGCLNRWDDQCAGARGAVK